MNWRYAAARCVGSSHTRSGTQCQDAWVCEILQDVSGEPVIAVVVADGAGSAERGAEGADVACHMMLESFRNYLLRDSLSTLDRSQCAEFVWQAAQSLRTMADDEGLVARDYACTLLLSAIGEASSLFLQIGDGGIGIRGEATDGWALAFWPQRGEYANTTNFLTDRDVDRRMDFAAIAGRVDETAVFSDGLQMLLTNSAARSIHAPFFDQVFSVMRASEIRGEDKDLSLKLELFLQSAAVDERTDDDRTLVLATRA